MTHPINTPVFMPGERMANDRLGFVVSSLRVDSYDGHSIRSGASSGSYVALNDAILMLAHAIAANDLGRLPSMHARAVLVAARKHLEQLEQKR